jgi:hypothetical protein
MQYKSLISCNLGHTHTHNHTPQLRRAQGQAGIDYLRTKFAALHRIPLLEPPSGTSASMHECVSL